MSAQRRGAEDRKRCRCASASTRQPSERPKISFVFPVHDPEYGGGLLERTQKHIAVLIELANPDLFYSPALVRWLARAPLSPERFCRVDRRDLSADIPTDLSLSRRLRFCSQHVAHVHALFSSYRLGDADAGLRHKYEYDGCVHDNQGQSTGRHAGRAADSSRRRSPPQRDWRLLPDGAGMVAPAARVSGAVHIRSHRCDSLLGGVERRTRSENPPIPLPAVSPLHHRANHVDFQRPGGHGTSATRRQCARSTQWSAPSDSIFRSLRCVRPARSGREGRRRG